MSNQPGAPNLNDATYELLRTAILHYDFVPGQRLDLTQLEQHLQVSRTPLKNALTRLEAEGLVEIHPRRGTFITTISVNKLEEDYKIRSALELYVGLCLYKYLTSSDYEFFTGIRIRMDKLASRAKKESWFSVVHEYLELDHSLHERLVICGGTPRIVKLWQQTNVHRQIGQLIDQMTNLNFDIAHFEHMQILEAIQVGSPERLNAALLNHLESSRLSILLAISS